MKQALLKHVVALQVGKISTARSISLRCRAVISFSGGGVTDLTLANGASFSILFNSLGRKTISPTSDMAMVKVRRVVFASNSGEVRICSRMSDRMAFTVGASSRARSVGSMPWRALTKR
ncbi:hypothetical protein ACRS85_01425 [Pluralibacter gergoviae]|uniref:hypothetical protein n=1 Tax=Pluralibacter gergoviae TaxID=61647 RepID=UPI003EE1CD2B